MRRTYAWVIAVLAVGALALNFAATNKSAGLQPDHEGKLTFRGPNYQLRVPREQFATLGRNGDVDELVELSVDRREFGVSDPPSGPPRVSCPEHGDCTDYCDPTPENKLPGCPDLENGWYRVSIMPASKSWENREDSARKAGPPFRCGDDGHPEMEFCWDPARYTPTRSITNAHDVPYAAIRLAADHAWISKARGNDGLPLFYTRCNFVFCTRFINYAGAAIELSFPFSELDNWQRIEVRLHAFAEDLIKPTSCPPQNCR
jgi:hypothetical protein